MGFRVEGLGLHPVIWASTEEAPAPSGLDAKHRPVVKGKAATHLESDARV